MERLTKTYDDGSHAAADNLPCGENSWNYKELLLNKLGAYEDTGLRPCEILVLSDKLKYASEQWDIWCNAYQKDVPVWIPVEEQLPEIGEPVLITLWNGCVDIGTWYGHRWGTALYYSEDVLAWMPKPENYRPAD